jgi:hypothetical protein
MNFLNDELFGFILLEYFYNFFLALSKTLQESKEMKANGGQEDARCRPLTVRH